MTSSLLVLRPEPGASATARAARAMGLEAIVAPLFTVHPLDWHLPERMPEAVLMTSANAARLAGPALASLLSLPLYAVGEATATAARSAGFTRIVTGEGGVEEIVARATGDGISHLLHLAGREHRTPTCAPLSIERRLIYAADPVDALPGEVARVLPDAVALLHSPRAAALFARLVEPGTMRIAAISPATRDAAGEGWKAVAVATQPTDASLLAAAVKLCNHRG